MPSVTRNDVLAELETLTGQTKEQMLTHMITWAMDKVDEPQKITDDLFSYRIYKDAS